MEFSNRPSLTFLRQEEIKEIHNRSLELLEETGVVVLHAGIKNILESAGSQVKGDVVKIPEFLVKQALNTVPSRIKLYGRDGNKGMILEGTRSYYGPGSGCPNTIDLKTGQRRKTTKEDIFNIALICDYLENIDFVMSMGLVPDKNPNRGYLEEFFSMVRITNKPIIVSAGDGENVEDIISIAKIALGERELKENPFFAVYSETTSPLRHSRDALEKLEKCAENWIPIINTVGIMAGATGPMTLAGSLVQANVELLSVLVIHQLIQPGAPFFYGGTITPIDMKTMAHPYGSPEFHVLSAALTELGRYYNMPVFSTGGCSDAKTFDEQAASEATYSLLLSSLSGGNLIHDVGYIDSGLTSSPHQIVFGNEIIGLTKHILTGISFSPEEIALDVIKKVGPGGNYLGEAHTLKNFKKMFYPEILERDSYEKWQGRGEKTIKEKLDEKLKTIVTTYSGQPLEPETIKNIENFIAQT